MKGHTPKRILVANRGEIALRVIRAIKELGHVPLTVYSRPDATSLHVLSAEGSCCIGEGPSTESYLHIKKIIKAAQELKADAIHPGYGFLSEKSEFAEEVQKANMIFIGPEAKSINMMGDKIKAKETFEKLGLPLVRGTKEGISDEQQALQEAKKIGFPVMIKAAIGGGGRGMRVVQREEDFIENFKRAYSESSKAFLDGRLYVEQYITSPHHVEVQILSDEYGNVRHLFERECSVQRRHQKLVEESPSPFLSERVRGKFLDEATKAIKKLGYVNLGTIEFLMDEKENFYFMEMNTRLQVEHPVTEWVTGIDLVQEQIRIGLGEKISFEQEDVQSRGVSIEFRINAEESEKFLPQAGIVSHVHFPSGHGVRVDSHIYPGWEVSVFYDSLIAKLSVWGRSRDEALRRGKRALEETRIYGIKHNIPFLLSLLENKSFIEGNYTTRLVGEEFNYQKPPFGTDPLRNKKLAALAIHALHKERAKHQYPSSDNSVKDNRSNWKWGKAFRP